MKKNERGMTLVELMIVVVILGVLAAVIIPDAMRLLTDFSDGDRVGTMVKFSNKGIFMKTWEGEVNLGQVDSQGQAEHWEFSLDPKSAHGECIKCLMDSGKALVGKRVKVKYVQRLYFSFFRGDSEYKALSITAE